jgi:hypothetical protein
MEDALIVSPWQFISRIGTYRGKINAGIKVLISGRRHSYQIEKAKDPYRMTKEEFFAKIDRAEQQYKEGKFTRVRTPEEHRAFLDSL